MGIPEALCKNSVSKSIRFIEPTFKLHTFTTEVLDKNVLIQVIKMIDSLMIFINAVDKMVLSDLSLGMINTRHFKEPIATKIMGNFTEDTSKNMALKLAKRLKKNVYVSFNLDNDKLMLPAVEKRLCEEIKNKPDKF